jgi:extradiol dioxygenase
MNVLSFAYVGFESPNFKEWERFGPEVFGLGLAEPGPDGTVNLRLDERHHRIAVHPGDEDRIAYIGWELRDQPALERGVEELERAGVTMLPVDPADRVQRAVAGLVRFVDPAGFTNEIFYGQRFQPGSFVAGKPMYGGFAAGPLGLGHVVVAVPEITDELQRFVTETLGFTYYHGGSVADPDGREEVVTRFYRCNARSHCYGFIRVPGKRGMQHLCIEVEKLDDVGRAYDYVERTDLPVTMTLGRHTMESIVSFYMRTPSGFDLEFGAGGVLIDDETWIQQTPVDSIAWGHRATMGLPPTVRPIEVS